MQADACLKDWLVSVALQTGCHCEARVRNNC